MAKLNTNIIRRIVQDYAPGVRGLRRVGVVGSYAREDHAAQSDVDLVFDLSTTSADDSFLETALQLRSVFMDQFRVELDIIKYDSILAYLGKPEKLTDYQLTGYRKMMEDLIWIWGDDA